MYTIDGKPAPRSVTGLLHEYASHFDASRAVAVMKGSRDWEMKRAQFEAQGLGVVWFETRLRVRMHREGGAQAVSACAERETSACAF